MSPIEGRDTNAGPSHKEWETGVSCEKDNNCVLKVKEVDKFYRDEDNPVAEHMNPEGRLQKKATKKRKRHEEKKQPEFTQKVQHTMRCSGDEEETILMHLRRADTVIDVTIKSPVKKKKSLKRLSAATKSTDSKTRRHEGSLLGRCASATEKLSHKSKRDVATV